MPHDLKPGDLVRVTIGGAGSWYTHPLHEFKALHISVDELCMYLGTARQLQHLVEGAVVERNSFLNRAVLLTSHARIVFVESPLEGLETFRRVEK